MRSYIYVILLILTFPVAILTAEVEDVADEQQEDRFAQITRNIDYKVAVLDAGVDIAHKGKRLTGLLALAMGGLSFMSRLIQPIDYASPDYTFHKRLENCSDAATFIGIYKTMVDNGLEPLQNEREHLLSIKNILRQHGVSTHNRTQQACDAIRHRVYQLDEKIFAARVAKGNNVYRCLAGAGAIGLSALYASVLDPANFLLVSNAHTALDIGVAATVFGLYQTNFNNGIKPLIQQRTNLAEILQLFGQQAPNFDHSEGAIYRPPFSSADEN